MDGFSYRGVHCEDMGCYYVPSEANLCQRMEEYSIESSEIKGKDGGYYMGATVSPRIFIIECYFENINDHMLSQIYEWLRRDESGDLVFDDRPYVSYSVYPSKRIDPKIYVGSNDGVRALSGTFSISFTAYSPFGKMSISSYNGIDHSSATNYSGIIESSKMPPIPTIDSTWFMMYNCGTEVADTIIKIAGTVHQTNGLLITNTTNGTKCKIINLQASDLVSGSYLEIDSALGQVRKVVGDTITTAFEYHDFGYIKLAPCTPFYRDVHVQYTAGSRSVMSDGGCFRQDMKGRYIHQNGEWKYISQVNNDTTITVNTNMLSSGEEQTQVVTMNTIVLTAGSSLTKLEVTCTP